jgi:hypothetical protein
VVVRRDWAYGARPERLSGSRGTDSGLVRAEEGRRGEFDAEGLTGGNGSRGSLGARAGRRSGGLL